MEHASTDWHDDMAQHRPKRGEGGAAECGRTNE